MLEFLRAKVFSRKADPQPARDSGGAGQLAAAHKAAIRHFEQLIRQARANLFFERACRTLAPPLIVIGFFISVSWTGLWLETPHWARALGVFCFAIALVLAALPARRFGLPSRRDALDRIDRVSGRSDRPAAALDDRLANNGDDPTTRALWSLHQRRAEESIATMRAGAPSPRLVEIDSYALRAIVLISLIATAFIAGPEKYARLAAAFDWRLSSLTRGGYRLDAWIDPPAYTGRAPIVLALHPGGAGEPQRLEAPSGSIVIIRSSTGRPPFEATGALVEAPKQQNDAQSGGKENEARLILRGNAQLKLGTFASPLGSFDLSAIQEKAPTIELTDVPKANARGSLTLKYKVEDDYGVISAQAVFSAPALDNGKAAKRSLVEAPQVALALPPGSTLGGEAETTIDLSEHPWAGARVKMTLSARDEGGNEGKSDPFELTLPQKPFAKPLARALVEQRRNLVLAPDDKDSVKIALEALMIAPEAFDTSAGAYLGLRIASNRLAAATTDGDLLALADYLWEMALQIENGGLSEAERDLRAAEQQLREALQRNAPEEEIRKLSENLRAALDKFLRELADQQRSQTGRNELPMTGQSRLVTPKDLQNMLDKMQEMAREGDAAAAEKMLERLQNILENLQMARPRKADPRAKEISRAIDELGQMSKDQQDLRDETYRNGAQARSRDRRERGDLMGRNDRFPFGDPFDDDETLDRNGENDAASAPPNPANEAELQKRQQALRDRLDDLRKKLGRNGAPETGLGDAQDAMGQAREALGKGPGGNDEAVGAQGRAVEALREGAQKLGESLRRQGGGQGASGEAEGDEGLDGPGEGDMMGDEDGADPLGRMPGAGRSFNPRARFDPQGAPAAQRAQRVLEELRRRLGEPSRPREELDYLERLLRRY